MANPNAQLSPAPLNTPMFPNVSGAEQLAPSWSAWFNIVGTFVAVAAALPISGAGLTVEGTIPQINGSGLGAAGNAPLEIQGSSTVDGRIVLLPGNVAGANKGRVSISGKRKEDPSLVVVEGINGSVSNGTGVFQVQDNAGNVTFQVLRSDDVNPSTAIFGGNAAPGTNLVYSLGVSNSNRWLAVWVADVNLSGNINSSLDNTTIIGSPGLRPKIAFLRSLEVIGTNNTHNTLLQGGDKSIASLIVKEASGGTTSAGIGLLQCQDASGNITFQVLGHNDPGFPDTVVMRGQHPGLDNAYDMGVLSGVHGSGSTSRWRDLFLQGVMYYGSVQTGGGAPVLSNNCPAATPGSIFTWLNFKDMSGNNLFVPAWK